jgi:hypothetical protein
MAICLAAVASCGDREPAEGSPPAATRRAAILASAGTTRAHDARATAYKAQAAAYREAAAKERERVTADAQRASLPGGIPATMDQRSIVSAATTAKREKLAALAERLAAQAQSAGDLHARMAAAPREKAR